MGTAVVRKTVRGRELGDERLLSHSAFYCRSEHQVKLCPSVPNRNVTSSIN